MKKYILILFSLLLGGMISSAQTTATDFTVNDCNGVSHHLFAELDAGKIIVMAMVDPCGSCIGPSRSAYNTVNTYATSNPGKVVFYLTDDHGNTSCPTLTTWGSQNGMGGVVTISNVAVNQDNYGGSAMPKILVLGGASHIVFFKQDNGLNAANLSNAINAALVATGVNEVKNMDMQLTVFPNPAIDKFVVDYNLYQTADVSFEIYNMLGAKVRSIAPEKEVAGKHESLINVETLNNGIYFLKLTAGDYTQLIKFTVAR